MIRLLPFLVLLACTDSPTTPVQDADFFPDFSLDAGLDQALPQGPGPGELCTPTGPACTRGQCEHGLCSPICSRDDDCPPAASACIGRGGAGLCTPRCASPADCAPGLICAVDGPSAGFCVAPGPGDAGAPCQVREDCASWFCSEGICLGACDTTPCAADRRCLDLYTQRVCVDIGPAPAEAPCTTGPDCQSGICRGGRCTEECVPATDCAHDRVCVAYAALGLCERRCEDSADCGDTGFCGATTVGRLCATRGPAPAGGTCTSNTDCASGRCDGNTCATDCTRGPCPAGQACVQDVGGATCRPAGPAAQGAPCDQGGDCQSGVCGGGLCTADCMDTPCPQATRCTRFADGDFCFPACRTDADCPEISFCDTDFDEGPTCFWRGPTPADAPCATDRDCESGECSDGTCLARCPDGTCPAGRTCRDFSTAPLCAPDPLPLGAACEARDLCADGLTCTAGRCLPACGAAGACPAGSLCHDTQCHPTCTNDTHCRPGRLCNAFDGDAPFCQTRGLAGVDAACTLSAECSTGLCFNGRCRARCEDTACPLEQTCVPLGTTRYCLTAGRGALGTPCETDGECRAGLCIGRRCAAPCVDATCPDTATCRSLRGGDFCITECDSVTGQGCLEGELCAPEEDGTGRCALPLGGAGIGQACTTLRDCTLTAVACLDAGDGRRCRSACDLAEGSCPDGAVCAPHTFIRDQPGACVPAGGGEDMAACSEADDCASGWCITTYQGGHCGRPCLADGDCPDTSRCVDLARNPANPFLSCAPRCIADGDCPDGLRCRRGLDVGGACY